MKPLKEESFSITPQWKLAIYDNDTHIGHHVTNSASLEEISFAMVKHMTERPNSYARITRSDIHKRSNFTI